MNALEQLTQSALVAEAQSKVEEPIVQKYTLEEALPLVKEQHELFTLEEAFELFSGANSVLDKLRNCGVSRDIINQYYYGTIYTDSEFFDLNIESFIASCKAITENPDDVDVPEDFIDDDDLREYFNDNSYEMWRRIDWGESLDKDSVREAYLEDNDIDLSEYIENFKL